MPALTTRQEARERLQKIFETVLDRVIPADETKALKGRTFADFEQQSLSQGNEVLAALLEERARLDEEAVVRTAGRCPQCESDRTYLEDEAMTKEIRGPCGVLIVQIQHARCRACSRSFSPSAPGLELGGGGSVDTTGRQTRGPRSRRAAVQQSRPGTE